MHRTTTALCAAALMATVLTACSGSAPKPAPTKTVTVTATPKLTKVQISAQCAEEVSKVIEARADDFDPETMEDPRPDGCDGLSGHEYMLAYMDGVHQANKANQDALQDEIDKASKAANGQ